MASRWSSVFRSVTHRHHFSEETLRDAEEVRRLISIGYDPRDDPESPYYRSRSDNPKPTGIDYGRDTKYSLVEMPAYLKGRDRMAKRNADLAELDYIIMILLRGDRLPKGANPHKLRGEMSGFMECHIDGRNSDWVLIYRYDNGKKLVLYAVNTGTHKECRVDRSLIVGTHSRRVS